MSTPPQAYQPNSGPIDDKDVEDWTKRFNSTLADPSGHLNSRSPTDAQRWQIPFCDCIDPVELCLVTWCLPCVTFGKTHHRVRKSGNMEGYEPINTSCILFCALGYCGCHWIPTAMQRADVRAKYRLQGNCVADIVTACCCTCCDLMQQEKESRYREPLMNGLRQGVRQQYQAEEGMAFPQPPAPEGMMAGPPPPPPLPPKSAQPPVPEK